MNPVDRLAKAPCPNNYRMVGIMDVEKCLMSNLFKGLSALILTMRADEDAWRIAFITPSHTFFENEMICAISETTREFLLNELDSCLIPLDNQGEPITKEDRLIVHEHF